MAIQVRRGYLKDFDPTKMLPGEWAVSIDSSTENQIVWMCFAPGVCKRIGTYEDFQNMIDEINGEIISEYQDAFNIILDEVKVLAREVSTNADEVAVMHTDIKDTLYPQIEQYLTDAETYATNSANSAEEAKTYAEEAKQYRDEAQQIADFDVVDVYSRIDLNKQTIGYQKKNLLKNNLEDTTSNGISCVVNEDKSVTLNGKNNGSSRSYFGLGETLDVLPAGEYYFNIDDGSLDDLLFDVSITLSYVSKPNEIFTNESYSTTKTKAIFNLIEPAIIRNANIIVNLNSTLDNVTVYPRVYPANIIDYGYEPYVENVDTRLSNAENKFDEYLPLNQPSTASKSIIRTELGACNIDELLTPNHYTKANTTNISGTLPPKWSSDGFELDVDRAYSDQRVYQIIKGLFRRRIAFRVYTGSWSEWTYIQQEGVTVWENASLSSVFGASTISLSLADAARYSRYEILYLRYYSTSGYSMQSTGILPFGTTHFGYDGIIDETTLRVYSRRAVVWSTSIAFDDCVLYNPASGVNKNNYCIPYKVIFYP